MLAARQAGQAYDPRALARRLEEAVTDVVATQVDCGIDVVNDGEIPKPGGWIGYFGSRLEGIEHRPFDPGREGVSRIAIGRDPQAMPEWYALARLAGGPGYSSMQRVDPDGPPPPRPVTGVATAPIRYIGHEALQADLALLQAAAAASSPAEAYLGTIGPSFVAWSVPNAYYSSDQDYLFALAGALHEEYTAIADAGVLLQVDEPTLTTNWALEDVSLPAYRAWLEAQVEALNVALAGIPEDRVRLHFCWGSWHAPHVADIPLRDVLDLILEVRAGAYSVEASNPRHEHEWQVWEDVPLPEGKLLIPGVVGHYSDYVEHPELVAQRIVTYANVVGRENVMAGTDCGLGTRVGHPEVAWAKFRSMAEGARLASERLWPNRRP
jgi:5-methyltetrahydropteroyltriglutamate--homocysteine methyltransferase